MNLTRLFDILDLYRYSYPDKQDAFARNEGGHWKKYTTQDYLDFSDWVSMGLLELGLNRGDKVATITPNRPEWNFIDMGLAQAGMVHVPIYPTLSRDDQKFILEHSESTILFVSDQGLFDKVNPVISGINDLRVYGFSDLEDAPSWNEILELGKINQTKWREKLHEIKKSIQPDDLMSIIYTSGTTGNPKGVMLSHHNILSNALTTGDMLPLDHTHRALSFLPLCHVYERMMNYNFQYNGVSIYYVENLGKIADFIREIKPHVFNTVPRLIEKVYDGIVAKGKDLTGIKRKLFFWALEIAHKFELNNGHGFMYEQQRKLADKLVFSKWRQGLGGHIKLMVSGGSALQKRLLQVFWGAGMPIYEGYGLTETSPVIAVNDPRDRRRVKFGTVGPALDGVKVRIAEDGEILCKGPNVMMGYFKNAQETKEVMDEEGWFHTGDIGVWEDGIFVRITDRKKEMFKTSSGKYIAPQVIENILRESSLIEQAMVVGENEKFASALISPNFNYLHFYASKHRVGFRDNEELIRKPEIIKRMQKEVTRANKRLGQTEQLKRFRMVCDEWSPQTGELSPTLKLKRKVIYDKYDSVLRGIYGHES
ncbi:MAG: long-chain fatty acid--CoA ligase [Bacteroidales bacterium]